jgi:hypothetical protein
MKTVMSGQHHAVVADGDHLLAGENSADERDPRVVERWIAVYSELVTYKERLQPVSSMWATAVSPEAAGEMARILQQRLLGDHLPRYRRRLHHWQGARAASA